MCYHCWKASWSLSGCLWRAVLNAQFGWGAGFLWSEVRSKHVCRWHACQLSAWSPCYAVRSRIVAALCNRSEDAQCLEMLLQYHTRGNLHPQSRIQCSVA